MLRGMVAALALLTLMALAATPTALALVAGQGLPLPPGRLVETVAAHLAPGPGGTSDYVAPVGAFEARAMAAPHAGRTWHALAAGRPGARPLVVLLHGSGRDGAAMIDMWQDVARREGLLLVAPDSADPAGWSRAEDGPAFLDALLAEVAALHPYDPGAVFLYGHSAGAMAALSLAADGPWRAVAAHGGAPRLDTLGPARRAVPLRVQIGDADPLFPLPEVRAAAAALARQGHDVELAVIPGHGHWLYDLGPRLAADAWSFFEAR